MSKFEINILGCGSALPTTKHLPSAQIVNVENRLYMIDCGEGSQLQMRRMRFNFNRLDHIFISHLHGDHFFGLPGLISTMALLGRKRTLTLYAHQDIDIFLKPILEKFCADLPYSLKVIHVDPSVPAMIMEDKYIQVYTFPLKHRIPTCGFLLQQQRREPNIRKDMVDFYEIPLRNLPDIKRGDGYLTQEGEYVSHEKLTFPVSEPKRYAYCSDTKYAPEILPFVSGVDLLYHESTFATEDAVRAKKTYHSTAKDAARIAVAANVKKLVLGHFSARYESQEVLLSEAKELFDNTILANENDVIVF